MKMPQGLAVKGSRILVADDGNHRVVELTTGGRFVKATSAKTGVRLRFPYDVAFDANGGAYVADNNLHRIVQLDRHLRRVRAWGTQGHGKGKFVFPRALAIQPNGHVLVADAGNDRVQEFTKTGGFVRSIGINGRARPHITAPSDVAANAFGEVAVADGNGRISWFDLAGKATGAWAQSKSFQSSTAVVGTVAHYDATGKLLATWPIPRPAGGEPSIPAGLAATSDGGVWAADANNGRLLRLTADGTIVETLGTPGTGAGQLAEPRGLELDCAGGLLVADSGNNRIVRFTGVAPVRGCATTTTPTAAGRPPAPVGLHVKTKDRAKRPGTRLGTVSATCRRTCALATSVATSGVIVGGRLKSFPLDVTISGSTITLKASATAVKAMRTALKKDGYVTAGVTVTATSQDGVVDTAGVTWQYH